MTSPLSPIANSMMNHIMDEHKHRTTQATAGPTGNEKLHPAQFSGKHRASSGKHSAPQPPNTPSKGTRGKEYEGKHQAHYSVGKDIGGSVGASKKPEYKGKHQQHPVPPHHVGKQNMGGGVGKNIPPPPESTSKPLGGTDNAKANAKAKKSKELKRPDFKKLRFRPSRHSGKNQEHLKALVK